MGWSTENQESNHGSESISWKNFISTHELWRVIWKNTAEWNSKNTETKRNPVNWLIMDIHEKNPESRAKSWFWVYFVEGNRLYACIEACILKKHNGNKLKKMQKRSVNPINWSVNQQTRKDRNLSPDLKIRDNKTSKMTAPNVRHIFFLRKSNQK